MVGSDVEPLIINIPEAIETQLDILRTDESRSELKVARKSPRKNRDLVPKEIIEASDQPKDGDGVLADKLSRALELSLDWDLQILKTELPPEDTDAFASVVRAKGQASQTVKMLAARIDDNELKRQTLKRLPDLIKLIQEEEGRMKLIESAVG